MQAQTELPPGMQQVESSPDVHRFERLLAWVQDRGATVPSLTLVQTHHGRSLRAARRIRKGELVLHLPREILITTEDARRCAMVSRIRERGVRLTVYGELALALLEHRRAGDLRPFIDMLPGQFAEHPFCWPKAELASLQASWILPTLRRRRRRLMRERARLNEALAGWRRVSWKSFLWASCCAWTRTFTICIDGEDTHALVPVADLLDHSSAHNVEWRKESSLGFLLAANRGIEVNEPLTLSYWNKPNARMLASFGFCIEDNPDEIAELRFPELPLEHPCASLAEGLGVVHRGERVFQVSSDPEEQGTRELLTWLRLSACSDAERVPRRYGSVDTWVKGWVEESKVLAALASGCRHRLSMFATSAEEDEKLLEDHELPLRLRFAVLARVGEKSVLRNLLHFAEAGLSGRENHDS